MTLQAADRIVCFAQDSRGFDRAELLLEGWHEQRPVFEHHALERFEVQLEFADLFLLDKEKLVDRRFIHRVC